MHGMSGMGPGGGTDDRAADTWTNETLPMARRRELLEHELARLGFRKAAAGGGASRGGQQPQQPPGESSHPQACGGTGTHGR
jgi:hypothetical protein